MITNPTIEKKKPTRQTNKQNKRIVISYIFYFKCPLLKKKNQLEKTLKLSITFKNWENIQLVNHAISC